ncbi:MAG TPA: universal stress protein [Nitrospiraceae bacterium]|nr:universal stress protein [Nitrospiraceae bacterium]
MAARKTEQPKDRHVLIAVDQTENSKRAVLYVADFLGGNPGFRATLLSVVPKPEEDLFENEEERSAWAKEKVTAANALLNRYREVLIHSGFPEDKVQIRSCVGEDKSLSEIILEYQCEMSCCTVVVGRHHKSKAEEFLFGSTSSQLVHRAENCAVWVVE